MATTVDIPDMIALIEDVPALGLTEGKVGVVVETFDDGNAFEVEFCDTSGETYGLHKLKPQEFVALQTRGQSLRLRVAAA